MTSLSPCCCQFSTRIFEQASVKSVVILHIRILNNVQTTRNIPARDIHTNWDQDTYVVAVWCADTQGQMYESVLTGQRRCARCCNQALPCTALANKRSLSVNRDTAPAHPKGLSDPETLTLSRSTFMISNKAGGMLSPCINRAASYL